MEENAVETVAVATAYRERHALGVQVKKKRDETTVIYSLNVTITVKRG